MDQHFQPIIDPNTRTLLVPAAATGIIYLIISGEAITFRIAVGAVLSALACGYYGALATARLLHLSPDWYAILGAAFGFIGHMLLVGVVMLGKAWREDPKAFLQMLIPWRRKE